MSSQQTHQFVDLDTPPSGGTLQPGTTLQNRYQIIETRNIGGMAVVYKAQTSVRSSYHQLLAQTVVQCPVL